MAKATAICTCKTCGAKFEKTAGIKLESKISDFDALYFRHCQEDKK